MLVEPVKITVHRWAGQKWFLRIRSECAECDLAVAQVRSLLAAHPDWPVKLEVKPWLDHLWESLRRGGWHAPVVMVNGWVICQGKVPTRVELEEAVRFVLSRRNHRLDQQDNHKDGPLMGMSAT
jgi:hypothetical protein